MSRTKAYRRDKQRTKTIRRAKNYAYWSYTGYQTYMEEFKQGQHTFLKTTGRPCNCWSCKYLKYVRPRKNEVQKLINDQLNY